MMRGAHALPLTAVSLLGGLALWEIGVQGVSAVIFCPDMFVSHPH